MVRLHKEVFRPAFGGQKGVITVKRRVTQGEGGRQVSAQGERDAGAGARRKVTPAERFRGELANAVGGASLDFSGYCRMAAQTEVRGSGRRGQF